MDQDLDFLREGVRLLEGAMMQMEVSQHVGAQDFERTPERKGQRDGHRDRCWNTRVGTGELKVPRERDGAVFPTWNRDAGQSRR